MSFRLTNHLYSFFNPFTIQSAYSNSVPQVAKVVTHNTRQALIQQDIFPLKEALKHIQMQTDQDF